MILSMLIDRACRYVVSGLPSKDIFGMAGLYLQRWTLFDGGKGRFRLSLHHSHRSDEEFELHTHPWSWAVSVQLAGGYREERRVGDVIVRRDVKLGDLNVILADTAHRVDLLDPAHGSWSLVLTGPVVASWGFWTPYPGAFTPWKELIRAKELEPIEPIGGAR